MTWRMHPDELQRISERLLSQINIGVILTAREKSAQRREKLIPQMKALANHCHQAAAARRLNECPRYIWLVARDAGIEFVTQKELARPSVAEWCQAASRRAAEANLPVSRILGTGRTRDASLARWKAIKDILDSNPQYSIKGVAEIIGYDHSTIMYAMRRLAGASYREAKKSRVVPREILAAE